MYWSGNSIGGRISSPVGAFALLSCMQYIPAQLQFLLEFHDYNMPACLTKQSHWFFSSKTFRSLSIDYLLCQPGQQVLSHWIKYLLIKPQKKISKYKKTCTLLMTCKRIWEFGVLGGMRVGYLLLFWAAAIHLEFFSWYSTKSTQRISVQLPQAHSVWLFPAS